MYEGLVESTWDLSDLMVGAANLDLFTTVAVANKKRKVLAAKTGWAGGDPEGKSCAPFIGPAKAMELLVDPVGRMAMTPTGNPLGCGYMGGVRQTRSVIHRLTSGSAWSGRCDAVFALVLNFAMENEVRFHHVGFR